MLSEDAMRRRFHQNRAERAAILARSAPLREERDRIQAEADARIRALNAQIREAETGLFDLDNEAGRLARALGGKTGPRPGGAA